MTIIKELDPVQGLVDYILEVKPFHTKVVDVLTEYVHTDAVNVTFIEQFDMEVVLEYPSTSSLDNDFTDAGGLVYEILPPDLSNAFVEPYGYDTAAKTITILGDRADLFEIGNSVLVAIRDTNGYLIKTVSYVVLGVQFTPPSGNDVGYTKLTLDSLMEPASFTEYATEDLQAYVEIPGSVTSQGDVGSIGTYGGVTPYGSPSAWPVVSYDQSAIGPFDVSALGYDHSNNIIVLPGDRTTEYTVGKSVEVTIYDANTNMPVVDANNPAVYNITAVEYRLPTTATEQQHTRLVLSSLQNPSTLTSTPTSELYATVSLTPFDVQSVVYGYAAGTHNDFYYDNVPGPTSPPNTPPMPTPGDQLNTPTPAWAPLLEPNESNFTDETNGIEPVHANSFVVSGNVAEVFTPGSVVELVGTQNVFQVLLATYNIDVDATYLRMIETIPPNITGQLKVRENLVGYSEVFNQNAKSNGSLSTNIVERISFSWNDNGPTTGNGQDVIDGYQFLISEATGNTIKVNGTAEGLVEVGHDIRVLYAEDNNGIHTVTNVAGSTITVSSTLTSSVGGWVEQT